MILPNVWEEIQSPHISFLTDFFFLFIQLDTYVYLQVQSFTLSHEGTFFWFTSAILLIVTSISTGWTCALAMGITLFIVAFGILIGGVILATKKDRSCDEPSWCLGLNMPIGVTMIVSSIICCLIPGLIIVLCANRRRYVSSEPPCTIAYHIDLGTVNRHLLLLSEYDVKKKKRMSVTD